MNNGKKLFYCGECKTNKYFTKIYLPSNRIKYLDNKNHSFIRKYLTSAQKTQLIADEWEKVIDNNLLERDDEFYRKLIREV